MLPEESPKEPVTSRVRAIAVMVVATFLGITVIRRVWWSLFVSPETQEITTGSLGWITIGLIALGFLLGLLAHKLYRSWQESDVKCVGGGVLGLMFTTNLCLGGACIPAATFLTVLGALNLIPLLLGAALSKLIARP